MMKKSRKILLLFISLIITMCSIISLEIVSNAATDMSISYNTHIQNLGWEADFSKSNGQISGTSGQSLRLEAIKIKLNNAPSGVSLKYQVHVENEGWQGWKNNGETAGTTGKSYRLEAIRIKLEGTKNYKVQYRAHVQNIGWQDWQEDGEMAGTSGQSLRLEAIQIRIVKVNNPTVEYCGHIEMDGWEQTYSRSNGQTSGTTGRSLGMQALKVKLSGVPTNANIQCQAHVQYQGWKNWANEGTIAGTTGLGLNLEAIKLKLNNLPGYSIQYRAHVQNIGWQDWKKDGEIAGTTGKNLRIEAIQIKLVRTDNVKPVITLKGNSTVNVRLGDKYVDAGATALDNIDGNITSKIITKSNVNTLKVGTYTVSYTVSDKAGNVDTKTRTVKVFDYMTGIEVTKPTKTEYNYGEDLNLSGLSVKAVMKSGNKTNVAINNCKITGYDKNKLGNQAVTVSYNEKIATFQVTVKDYITNLEIVEPTKKEYNYGEDLNLSGLSVKAVMKSGNKTNIAINNCKITGYDKNKIGDQTVTINYGGKAATFKVKVNNYVTGIEIAKKPTKNQYIEGERIDLTGLVVNAVMADKTKIDVTDKITTVPSAEVLYKTETVYVSYTTTNTIDKTSKTFECEFPVTVNKAFSKIVINQEKNTGYAHEEFIYGTISSGEGEETIKIANLKYQIKDESGKDITTDGLVKVTFETEVARPEEILIKVTAEKIGKYTIVAYVGENINDSNVIKSEEQQIEISCSQVVKTAEILDFVDANVRINKTIIKDIKFTNAYGDELTNVANNEISIIGDGIKITLLDETGKPGSIVRKLQIQGIQEGTTNIKIILNKGTENETQPISLGNITVQAKAKEMLDIGSLTQIKLLQEKPEESISNVIVVNEIPYSLVPVKLVDEDNIERKIKANEFTFGDATSENKFGVKYTDYDPNELIPLLDIQMFKDGNIVNSSSSLQEIDAIGIALTEGTTQEELENKDIILQYYGSSTINLKMEVEELKIKSLVVIPENVDNVSKLPKVENHIKTTIGTIKPGEDNRTLNISDLNYQVKDENGKDITNSMINGKKMIKVTFESEVARPGEILINVETQKEGNYTIIPYIEIGSNKIFTEQEIESVNNSVVNNVKLPELSTAQLEVNTPFESTIIFKNSYGDILNVSQNTIEVTGTDLTITLLEGTSPVDPDNGEQNVTGIQVFAQSAGSKTLSITVNKGTTDEKTVKIQIVVANVATVQLNIGGMNKIYLYENKPETTDYITSVISEDGTDIVYTLIPISLSDGTKLRGNCLINNKLTLTISNDDELSIDVKMFKDKDTVSEDGEEVEYIGIALGMGYEESELIGETITLRYESSSKTLTIEK